jgi:hypothetical protein
MSLMVVGLVGGLMGSAVADFSDIETSQGNFFSTGELNLKVSDFLGVEYEDPNVPAFIQLSNAWPCCTKDYYIDLHNAGEGDQFIPYAYIHFKNFECSEVPAKDGSAKPEPELAAEMGTTPVGEDVDGNLIYACENPYEPASATNPALIGGPFGENCELSKHIDVQIFTSDMQVEKAEDVTDWAILDLSMYDVDPADGIIKLNEVECKQIELGQIPNCNKLWLDIKLHLQDVDEDDLGFNLFDETIPAEAKWDHWPTNALMKDKLGFDMSFELLQNQVP